MQKTLVAAAIAAGIGFTSMSAQAWEMQSGDWLFSVTGTVNGFYVYRTFDDGQGKKTSNSKVENGLLPAWINFALSTKVDGWDVKAHFGFAPGINDKSTIVGLPEHADPATGLSPFSQIDTRNAYLAFGNPAYGTFKFGRDIGIFGQNIVLSDMTILGVGGTANAAVPFNTTFGMISHGYMYTGFQPQITWVSPDFDALKGLNIQAGIFQPNQFAGDHTSSPGFQAMVQYDFKTADVSGKAWTSVVTQSTQGQDPVLGEGFNATGWEGGIKASFGGFELVGYGFAAHGLGASTIGALYFLPRNFSGGREHGSGYFVQGTYKVNATKFGLSYGQNTDVDSPLCGGCDRKTPAMTAGLYYNFNKYVTLTGEYTYEQFKTNAPTAKANTLSLGAILFF
jgi:predicted porin